MAEKMVAKKKIKTELGKAVKNIKKHIESGSLESKTKPDSSEGTSPKPVSKRPPTNEKFKGRGVVYLGHIPHGFYEKEMHGFFSQFGRVTRLRLVRSHKTGNSCGYAFIEFLFSEIAQVVAETMNNYLMRNRVLKAEYIPSEKVGPKMFHFSKNYGPETCLGFLRRRKAIKTQNKNKSDAEIEKKVKNQKDKLQKLQEKLKAQGVDFLFQIDNGTSEILSPKQSGSKPSQVVVGKQSTAKSSGKDPAGKMASSKVSSAKSNSAKASLAKEVKKEKQIQPSKKKPEKVNVKTSANAKKNATVKKINVKNTTANKVPSKNSKKVATKNVQSKKTATKSTTSKKVSVKDLNAKKISVKKITTKKSAPKKK